MDTSSGRLGGSCSVGRLDRLRVACLVQMSRMGKISLGSDDDLWLRDTIPAISVFFRPPSGVKRWQELLSGHITAVVQYATITLVLVPTRVPKEPYCLFILLGGGLVRSHLSHREEDYCFILDVVARALIFPHQEPRTLCRLGVTVSGGGCL